MLEITCFTSMWTPASLFSLFYAFFVMETDQSIRK